MLANTKERSPPPGAV